MHGCGSRGFPSAFDFDTLGGWPCADDSGGTVMEGATGSVVTGGVIVPFVRAGLGQFAARWRMWNVSICGAALAGKGQGHRAGITSRVPISAWRALMSSIRVSL